MSKKKEVILVRDGTLYKYYNVKELKNFRPYKIIISGRYNGKTIALLNAMGIKIDD